MNKDHKGGEVFPTMNYFYDGKKRKLNYVIHNPNTVEMTAKVLLSVLVQANAGKVERKLRELSEYKEVDKLEKEQIKVAGII